MTAVGVNRCNRFRKAIMWGGMALALVAGFLSNPTHAAAGNGTAFLYSGEILNAGQHLVGSRGTLEMQTDGNLVYYSGSQVIWSTGTSGSNYFLEMQADGNLVVYDSGNQWHWQSGTGGRTGQGVYLQMQPDFNLVLYTSGGTGIWSIGLSESCTPGRTGDSTTRWDGGDRTYTGIGGIYGTIKVYAPQVTNWSSAWVMLYLQGSSTEHHVQAGWDEYTGNSRYIYYEYTYNNNGSWYRWDDPAPGNWINASNGGSSHTFTVLWNNTPNEYTLELDGTAKHYTYSDFTPNNGQAYGETHSKADQMAGGSNNVEDFSGENIWVPTYNWIAADLTAYTSNSSWYNDNKVSSTHYKIYDTACST